MVLSGVIWLEMRRNRLPSVIRHRVIFFSSALCCRECLWLVLSSWQVAVTSG